MKFEAVNPETLTIYQLRQGIAQMGGSIPQHNVLKARLVTIFKDCQYKQNGSRRSRSAAAPVRYHTQRHELHKSQVQQISFAAREEVARQYPKKAVFEQIEQQLPKKHNSYYKAAEIRRFVSLLLILASSVFVFILATIAINLYNQKIAANIGVIAMPFVKMLERHLPASAVKHSKSLTTIRPDFCPYNARCDDFNQVIGCAQGFVVAPAGYNAKSDIGMRLINWLYVIRLSLRRIYFAIDEEPPAVYYNRKCVLNETYALIAEKKARKLAQVVFSLTNAKLARFPRYYVRELTCLLGNETCDGFFLALPLAEITKCDDELVCELLIAYIGRINDSELLVDLGKVYPSFSPIYNLRVRFTINRVQALCEVFSVVLKMLLLILGTCTLFYNTQVHRTYAKSKNWLRSQKKMGSGENDGYGMTLAYLYVYIFEHSLLPSFVQYRIMRSVGEKLAYADDVCCGSIKTAFGDYQTTFRSGVFELERREFSQSLIDEESTHEIYF